MGVLEIERGSTRSPLSEKLALEETMDLSYDRLGEDDLMCILVYPASSWTDLTIQFVT